MTPAAANRPRVVGIAALLILSACGGGDGSTTVDIASVQFQQSKPKNPHAAGFAEQPAQLVNTTTAGNQIAPYVAALANGGYVAVWNDGPTQTTPAGPIHAQIYDAAGSKVGNELQYNQGISAAGVIGLPSGGFAIALSQGIAGVSYASALQLDATGVPTGPPQPAFSGGSLEYFLQVSADDISLLPGGGYLVAGRIADPRPPLDQQFLIGRFDAGGVPIGSAVTVAGAFGSGGNPFTSRALPNGGWVSAWQDVVGPYSPTAHDMVYMNVYSATGDRVSSVALNSSLQGEEFSPSIAVLSNGNFLVAWRVRPLSGGSALPPWNCNCSTRAGLH